MSEKQNNQPTNSEQSYSFYWNYNDQLAADRKEKRKNGKKGLIIYATVLASVFLVCFAMLAGTIVWTVRNSTELPNVQESLPNDVQNSIPENPQEEPQEAIGTAAVVEKIKSSVVLIQISKGSTGGSGTGFFLTSDGYIVTNAHVVEGAKKISVTLYDETVLDATLVGYRAEDDLAIIKIEGTGYPPLAIGDSDVLLVGDVAIAVGNPGGAEGGWTATKGIVSATNRILSIEETSYFCEIKMIQTDAHVNPGNSGGPLCNEKGEVIGIVTRKMTEYEGMGYAIPINEAMRTLTAILEGKLDGFVSTVSKSRPKIGITGSEISKGDVFTLGNVEYTAPAPGFFVLEVATNSGAYGIIEVGDILCSVNGVTVTGLESFKNELYKCYVGQTVTFELYRKGQKMAVKVVVGMS